MKKIDKFKACDGREFDDAELCEEHERMIERVTAIMATLPPTPENINEGWIQHDKAKVLAVKRALLKLAKPLFKGYPKIEAQIAENPDAIHPMSFVGRLFDDCDTPINDGWRRLCCIDDKFREHNQPYFAINGPDKNHKQLN